MASAESPLTSQHGTQHPQQHQSPRFARAYELLRRREEMKHMPDPFPPIEAPRPAVTAPFSTPASHVQSAAAPIKEVRTAPSRRSLSLEEIGSGDEEFASGAESEHSPKSSRDSTTSNHSGTDGRLGTVHIKDDQRKAGSALGRLALDEGLSSSSSHERTRRKVTRRPFRENLKPLSKLRARVSTDRELGRRRGPQSSSVETDEPRVRSSSAEKRGTITPVTPSILVNATANLPLGALPKNDVVRSRNVASLTAAEMEMHRRYQMAMSELGRLREVQKSTERVGQPTTTANPIRPPPQTPSTRVSSASPKKGPSTETIAPRYRDPMQRRAAVSSPCSVDNPTKESAPRKAPLPAAARGPPLTQAEIKAIAASRGAGIQSVPKKAVPSTKAASQEVTRSALKDPSSSPPRKRPSEYTLEKYEYSKRLLSAHEALRRQRLNEIRQSVVHTTTPLSTQQKNTTRSSPGRSSTPIHGGNGSSCCGSRSASTASAVRHPPKVWDSPIASSKAPRVSGPSTPKAGRHVSGPWSNVPLMEFVHNLFRQPLPLLIHELSFATADDPKWWLALTVLLNHPAAVRAIVAPLLTELLLGVTADAASQRDQVLCCIAGFGPWCATTLESLMSMLRTGSGDRKLVALAVRCVGGQRGIEELLRVLESTTDSQVAQGTAAYALGLLTDPIPGFSCAICAAHGGASAVTMLRLPSPSTTDNGDKGDGALHHVATKPRDPSYVPTHAVIDPAKALRALQQYLISASASPFSEEYPGLRRVAETFVDVCGALPSISPSLTSSITSFAGESSSLRSADDCQSTVLNGGYASLGFPDALGERIVTSVMRYLSTREPGPVGEKLLLAMARLPPRWTAAYLPAMLALANGRFATVEIVLSAAAQCIGCMLQLNRATSVHTRDALEFLARLVSSSSPSSSMTVLGALAGIASAGPAAAALASAVADRWLSESNLEIHEAAVSCLAHMGVEGTQRLIAVAKDRSRPDQTRTLAIRGLVTAISLVHRSEVASSVQDTLEAIVRAERSHESIVTACLEALGRVALQHLAVPLRENQEAAVVASRCPKLPSLQIFIDVLEGDEGSEAYPFSARFAAADTVARFGGAVGESYLIQAMLKHADHTVRMLAANVLVHTGGSPVLGLLLAVNDATVEVREEALETLRRIGLPTIVSTLRGPQRNHLEAAHRFCTDFLRFQYDEFVDAVREEISLDVVRKSISVVRVPTPSASTVEHASSDT